MFKTFTISTPAHYEMTSSTTWKVREETKWKKKHNVYNHILLAISTWSSYKRLSKTTCFGAHFCCTGLPTRAPGIDQQQQQSLLNPVPALTTLYDITDKKNGHYMTSYSKWTWCLTSTETIRRTRRGGWVKLEIIYLSLLCHHQNDSCIKMGSDESHFNVLLIVRDKVTRQRPQTTTFEEKGEPKRNRTEVLLLTSLTPYRWAKPAHETSYDFLIKLIPWFCPSPCGANVLNLTFLLC